jgi:hypothetical protein
MPRLEVQQSTKHSTFQDFSPRRSLETSETLPSSCLADVRRLRSFCAFGDLELYRVAFLQALVSLGCDRAVVNENIGPIGAADETISFGVIEPLDGSFQAFHVPPLSARPLYSGAQDVPAVLYDAFWSEGVGVSRESQKAEVKRQK